MFVKLHLRVIIYICEFTFVNLLRSVSNTAVNLRSQNFKAVGFQPCDSKFTFVNWGLGCHHAALPRPPVRGGGSLCLVPSLASLPAPRLAIPYGLGWSRCAVLRSVYRLSSLSLLGCALCILACALLPRSRFAARVNKALSLAAALPRPPVRGGSPPCQPAHVLRPARLSRSFSALPALRARLAGRAACRASGCAGFLPSRAPFFIR